MRKADLHVGARVSLKCAARSGTVAAVGTGAWVTIAWDDGEAYKVNVQRLQLGEKEPVNPRPRD